ncbi:NACHT, LRR and PYD domains-containing protein 12-like isoform X1 [Hypomesus transpacificus]|uniref:NACHT, LRR and PYD domains-containing protein 12-like isoform X1 n=2 Tax=Hypomesus transpacificus TaxID=137520 RepID=UPI001F0787AF|nr:NACHT, LRR and PYD domains-containing protein 12-like isoform X1 [Hypomesus transpacificus]
MSLSGERDEDSTASETGPCEGSPCIESKIVTHERTGSCVPMEEPIYFRQEPFPAGSDQFKKSESNHQDDVIAIFKLLEQNVITLVRKHLKIFRGLLHEDYPESFESQKKEEEPVDAEFENTVRDGALKITLHVLRSMNQNKMADTLEKNELVAVCQRQLKCSLKKKYQCVFEGMAGQGNPTLLNNIYTDLFITESGSGGVNNEHEVRQIETKSRTPATAETPIKCQNLFKPLPGQGRSPRTVLTTGIAGIGKTISVQKFIQDWAEGRANQNIQFIFPLPFRELNLENGRQHSLMSLLHLFCAETKDSGISSYDKYNVLFVLDGLDECRLPLDFTNNKICCDVTETTSVDVLLTNLIKGKLFPSALRWITSRPTTANQIPSDSVDLVTEVRGFNDLQKEVYLRKRISDENMASRIIEHIKMSRSLHIMCHIPVFSCIAATVLERLLREAKTGEMPKTLTQMYTHFLVYQTQQKNQTHPGVHERDPPWDKETVLKLGKLAFKQLEKGHLIFYEEDLRECDIDVTEASVYSGVCTQIFREERGLYQRKVFSFVHLSIQEFLSALYVFLTFKTSGQNPLVKHVKHSFSLKRKPEIDLHKTAVNQALESENGHRDLFLRFLLGLSLESNQAVLQGLLTQTGTTPQTNEETVKYIKTKIKENPSPERCINLFHCLNELRDCSLVEEIQSYLSSGDLSQANFSSTQWSALVFVLLTSKEKLNVFDLKEYSRSEEGLLRLLPVIKVSKTALLNKCHLTLRSCEELARALSSNSSHLTELDLSDNSLEDAGVIHLCAGMSLHSRLETLRLNKCCLTGKCCEVLASALTSNTHMKDLDLSNNNLQDSGLKLLHAGLENIQVLRLNACHLTERSCEELASVLCSTSSHLKELDVSMNPLQDSGVMLLSAALGNPQCRLETLSLCECQITEQGCKALASALVSESSHMRELNLSDNNLQDSGAKQLSAVLGNQHCKLETIQLSFCGVGEEGCACLASALKSNPTHLRQLDVSYNHPGDSELILLSSALKDPNYKLQTLRVQPAGLCWSLRRNACNLTLDVNTSHRNLSLSDGGKKVTWKGKKNSYSDHPKRFTDWSQVLCREGLTGSCYWEVEWSGLGGHIGVAYEDISRAGKLHDSLMGHNDNSWCLSCSGHTYTAWHSNIKTCIDVPMSNRVGVYLDWQAGSLSFYSISSDTYTLLYTFHSTFTKAIYPGFWVWEKTSMSLC